MSKRFFLIVLDSFGMGELPDAAAFGDEGSNTLAAVAAHPAFAMPNARELGLFNIEGAAGAPPVESPRAAFARLAEKGGGKDTTAGHWEIAGVIAENPLPTYPNGFPPEVVAALKEATGRDFLCNKPYSGTDALRDYGPEHVRSGSPILYTSADSVLQIAAHEGVVPLDELYSICAAAREVMQGVHAVGRIIARPFAGDAPNFARTTNRHDYSLPPPAPTMLDRLSAAGLDVIAVGKIHDIYAGQGVTRSIPTKSNDEGMERTIELAKENFEGLCFVNLVDFDMKYGHRNDVEGYATALSAFDRQLGNLLPLLGPEDALMLTADHGCDPSTPSTDHSREYVPMLLCGKNVRGGTDLGTRPTFADIAATVQEFFALPVETGGTSFWKDVTKL